MYYKSSRYASTAILVEKLIASYADWMMEYVDWRGWSPYLLTFMFKPMTGRVMEKMADEVERVYSIFLTRAVRKPRLSCCSDLPLLLAVPDLPVAKRQKSTLSDVSINDGLHVHGIMVVPRNSRLKTDVVVHFRKYEGLYVKNRLLRLDVRPIEHNLEAVVDYAFKSVKRKKCDPDDILLFPKATANFVGNLGRNRGNLGTVPVSNRSQAHKASSDIL
jgi:hypothetical protein